MVRIPQPPQSTPSTPPKQPGAPEVLPSNEAVSAHGERRTGVQLPWLWQNNGGAAPAPPLGRRAAPPAPGPRSQQGIELTDLLSVAVALDVLATTTDGLKPEPTVLTDLAEALVALRDGRQEPLAAAREALAELSALASSDEGPERDRMAVALIDDERHKLGAPTVLAQAHPEAVCHAIAHLRALAALLCHKAELAVDAYGLRKQLRP